MSEETENNNPAFTNAMKHVNLLPLDEIEPTAESVEEFFTTKVKKKKFMDDYLKDCHDLPMTAEDEYFGAVLNVALWHAIELKFGQKKSTYDLARAVCLKKIDLIVSGDFKVYPESEFPEECVDAWMIVLDTMREKGKLPDFFIWTIDEGALILIFSIAFYDVKPLEEIDPDEEESHDA